MGRPKPAARDIAPRAGRRIRRAWWSLIAELRALRYALRPGLPRRLEGWIALIPVHEDAYTLPFSVRSFAPVVERVLLCLDAPDDPTLEAVRRLEQEFANVSTAWATAEGVSDPAGWAATRNRAIEVARERFGHLPHVLMVDADDILSWTQAEAVLYGLAADPRVLHAKLGICELIGDWVTTARGRTLVYDRNHVYWRGSDVDVHFTTDEETRYEYIHVIERTTGREVPAGLSPLAVFHAVLAKPGEMLVRRAFVRGWLQAGGPGSLDDFAVQHAPERFPIPWPEGLMPSEHVIFNDPYRTRPIPLAGWRRRLPPPVLQDQLDRPRFRMDLAARRRHDTQPPAELERRIHERLSEATRQST